MIGCKIIPIPLVSLGTVADWSSPILYSAIWCWIVSEPERRRTKLGAPSF